MRKKSKRGFASMSPKMQRAISSMGGKAAHEQGRGHEFTVEEARKAGGQGGRAISKDRQFMADIGRKGGQAKARNRRRAGRSQA